MSLTDSVQRQPGSNVALPNISPGSSTTSMCPRGKSRRSSGLSMLLISMMGPPFTITFHACTVAEQGQEAAGPGGQRLSRP